MTASLDLSKRHFTYNRGDITVIGSWLEIEGRNRPCLVLLRTGREMADDTMPFAVTVDKAWIWSEEVGDPQQAFHTAYECAESLGLAPTKREIIRIASMICDLLDDLLNIPPLISPPATATADITIHDRRTGKTREVAL